MVLEVKAIGRFFKGISDVLSILQRKPSHMWIDNF